MLALQEAFQAKEKAFAHIVKVGRTEMQDAVLMTLGREMGAYAEALNRDRWRLAKCEERLRVVNLGGTAIGTGLAAPRDFIFRVVDELREITGLGLARAENLVEATQNADVFVEVSGPPEGPCHNPDQDLRRPAPALQRPRGGPGRTPATRPPGGQHHHARQSEPRDPRGRDPGRDPGHRPRPCPHLGRSLGSLELQPFMPLVAHSLLESFDLLARACEILRRHCVEGLEADEARCRPHVENGTAAATALLPLLGYEGVCELAALAQGRGLKEKGIQKGFFTEEQFEALTSAEAVGRLGWRRLRP